MSTRKNIKFFSMLLDKFAIKAQLNFHLPISSNKLLKPHVVCIVMIV